MERLDRLYFSEVRVRNPFQTFYTNIEGQIIAIRLKSVHFVGNTFFLKFFTPKGDILNCRQGICLNEFYLTDRETFSIRSFYVFKTKEDAILSCNSILTSDFKDAASSTYNETLDLLEKSKYDFDNGYNNCEFVRFVSYTIEKGKIVPHLTGNLSLGYLTLNVENGKFVPYISILPPNMIPEYNGKIHYKLNELDSVFSISFNRFPTKESAGEYLLKTANCLDFDDESESKNNEPTRAEVLREKLHTMIDIVDDETLERIAEATEE